MTDCITRELVLAALHKVTNALDSPLAPRLRDPDTNVQIAELGIDSLDALEWCMEIEAQSGVEVDPAYLLTHNSIDALVELLAERKDHSSRDWDEQRLTHSPRDMPLPLSFSQERIWRYCRTPEDSFTYVLRLRDRIPGRLTSR